MRNLKSRVVIPALTITIAAISASPADAATTVRPLLVSAQASAGAFLPQNAARTKGILALNGLTGAAFSARGHRTTVSGPGASVFLARFQPFQAVVVIQGAHPRRVPLTITSIQYVPGFGLSAQVTVERRSRSAQLRRRLPGASARPPAKFQRATLFAAPTGVRVDDAGRPVAPHRLKNYPVPLQIHSTLPVHTLVEFSPQYSKCANSPLNYGYSTATNPQDLDLTAFHADTNGSCFWTPTQVILVIRVTYPDKNRDYQSVWAYLTITQVGPVYVATCNTAKQSIHLGCAGRLTGVLDAGVNLTP